jgi:hypothetical protein
MMEILGGIKSATHVMEVSSAPRMAVTPWSRAIGAVGGKPKIVASRDVAHRVDVSKKLVSKLSEDAAKKYNEHITEAGRAFTKHASGQRPSGTFPKLKGGTAEINQTAQKLVDEILNNPRAVFTRKRNGKLVVRKPDGQGLRFHKDGSLDTFLDPIV